MSNGNSGGRHAKIHSWSTLRSFRNGKTLCLKEYRIRMGSCGLLLWERYAPEALRGDWSRKVWPRSKKVAKVTRIFCNMSSRCTRRANRTTSAEDPTTRRCVPTPSQRVATVRIQGPHWFGFSACISGTFVINMSIAISSYSFWSISSRSCMMTLSIWTAPPLFLDASCSSAPTLLYRVKAWTV